MKINYEAIQDIYSPQPNPVNKGPGKCFCNECHKTVDEKQFFRTSRLDKFPAGVLPVCKTCITMKVNDTDQTTFLPVLKEVDVPYIPSEWRGLVLKKPAGGPSILGKYISKMHLNQFKKYRWADSVNLAQTEAEALLSALRQETETESDAENRLDQILGMTDIAPVAGRPNLPATNLAVMYGLAPETSKYNLTQDEINKLKRDWGDDYSEDQYLALEQLLADMRAAYIIQDPLAVSNAKMICKMSCKMNKFLDIDDVESASKISRQLDLFIKTANLAPVQQKDRQQTTFAISQLAFLVEHEGGFIPEFYIAEPNDKLDVILQDMQLYTEKLIRGESNITEMAENTAQILAQEELPEAVQSLDDFRELERELLGDIDELEEDEDELTNNDER